MTAQVRAGLLAPNADQPVRQFFPFAVRGAENPAGAQRQKARAAIALGAMVRSTYNAAMFTARYQKCRILAVLAALALLLRVMIPVGFMPSTVAGGWYLELCPDGMPEHVMVTLYGEHHAHHGAGDDSLFFECDYGTGATGAFALAGGSDDHGLLPQARPLAKLQQIKPPFAPLFGFQSRAPPSVVRYPANLT